MNIMNELKTPEETSLETMPTLKKKRTRDQNSRAYKKDSR